MADEAVSILERSITERINVHRRELDDLDGRMVAMRDEIGKDIHAIREDLTAAKTLLEANNALLNKFIVGLISVGGMVIVAAVAVILFGPGA